MPESRWNEKEFLADLNRLKTLADPAIEEGLGLAANEVINEIKINQDHIFIPAGTVGAASHKHFYQHTGNLMNSLYPRADMPGKITKKTTEIQIELGAQMDYAVPVEKGTPDTKAYPFMEPAMVDTRDRNLRIMADAISKVLS